jgi:peroxiredoxin
MKKSKSKNLLIVVIGLWIGIFLGVAVIVVLVINGSISLGGNSDQQLPALISLGGNSDQQLPALAKMEDGSPANDFELENLEGEKTRLSDLRGKVVVANYWATWCGPCVDEMPMFETYAEQYPNFVMLGIDEEESMDEVKSFLSEMDITYPILLDKNAKVAEAYKVFMLPSTFFIDEEGMVRYRHYGVMSQEQFTYYLESLGVLE